MQLNLRDAYEKVRTDGNADASKTDSAFAQVIEQERSNSFKHDQQMLRLARSVFYQASTEDFRANRLNSDGSTNLETLYRFHSRLVRMGIFLERNNARLKQQQAPGALTVVPRSGQSRFGPEVVQRFIVNSETKPAA